MPFSPETSSTFQAARRTDETARPTTAGPQRLSGKQADLHDQTAVRTGYGRVSAAIFVLFHLLPLLAFWTGVTWQSVALCVALYVVRMFGVTGGYHRYFSHRTYETSRVVQLLMAFLAQTSNQRGVLWWAAHHRHHHKFSDTDNDVHSPVQRGFWYAHVGWMWDPDNEQRQGKVRDLTKYPELVWLDRNWMVPPLVLGVACLLIGGLPGLLIGYFLSTVLLWHGTFTINSLCHVWGNRRYDTTDDSRNNLWLALLTLGEGWHNNHHHDMLACRQGFFWWEIDLTYYTLKAMSWVGLVWNLRPPKGRDVAG